jgi:hypothetical protein
VSKLDSEYLNSEQAVLFEVIPAANYLGIKTLIDLTLAKVASMFQGRNDLALVLASFFGDMNFWYSTQPFYTIENLNTYP